MMTIIDVKPLTEVQVQELVTRAGMLLRFRPVPGSDPKQAKLWLRSVAEYLGSEALRQVLRQLGMEAPADLDKPFEAQSPMLDQLAQLLDNHDSNEDNPAAAVIIGAVGAAYIGLVGYAIYWNVTHMSSEGEHHDGGSDGGASG